MYACVHVCGCNWLLPKNFYTNISRSNTHTQTYTFDTETGVRPEAVSTLILKLKYDTLWPDVSPPSYGIKDVTDTTIHR